MGRQFFEFKNGDIIPIADVLCGDYETDYPITYLTKAADNRPWNGKASATQAIAPTRQKFLEEMFPHKVNLDKYAFGYFGTMVHAMLESKDYITELKLVGENIHGTMDLLEPKKDQLHLKDHKVWGSFAFKKFEGIVAVDVPSLDPAGNKQYFKSGAKKGQLKTHKENQCKPELADKKDIGLQMNTYRYLVEDVLKRAATKSVDELALMVIDLSGKEDPKMLELLTEFAGKKIDKMFVFFIIRDGGLAATKANMIKENTYVREIERINDDILTSIVIEKAKTLSTYINQGHERVKTIDSASLEYHTYEDVLSVAKDTVYPAIKDLYPPLCSEAERWGGAKCTNGSCPVADFCNLANDNPHLKE